METPKTGTERAVAFAFPELVDNSLSINDDELSVISFDDCNLNGDLMQDGADVSKENIGEVIEPFQKEGTISNGSIVDIANRGGQGGDDENNSQCNEYLIDFEIPSTPPTPATTTSNVTTAHSQWLTPTLRREKQQQPAVARTSRVTLWECLCLAAIFFVLAICVSVIVVIVGRYGSSPAIGTSIGTEGVVEPPPTASPSVARLHRLEAIREWLQLDLPLPGGTPQEAALDWMVSSDFSYILGATIPSKAEYNLYNQVVVENANNNSVTVAYVNDEHKEMERFLFHVTQRYALLVFYFATGMDSPLGGWATMTGARLHECIWPGVVCRGQDDAVKELELNPSVYGAATPTGSIPSEIGMLQHIGTTARRSLFVVLVFYC